MVNIGTDLTKGKQLKGVNIMFNTIKVINMSRIYENLLDKYREKPESELEELCWSLEKTEEFRKLFFFINNSNHDCLYHSSKEKKIKDQITKTLNGIEIPDSWFYNYGEELVEYCDSDEVIELHDRVGAITISMANLYESLSDEFLKEDKFVDRLVNAPDFKKELAVIKKECLAYLFDMAITEAREELEAYEFQV